MGWKVYFVAVIMIVLLGVLGTGLGDLFASPLEIIITLVDLVGLLGLYSYSFKKHLFSQGTWKLVFWLNILPISLSLINAFIPLYNLIPLEYFSKYKIDLNNVFNLITFVFFLPSLYALYKLSYGKK